MIVSLMGWENPFSEAVEKQTGERVAVCRSRDEALKLLPEAEIILTLGGRPLLDEEMVAAAKKLKLVLSASAGVERLPMQALHSRDIAVCNARGAHAVCIAEFVLGGMLAMCHSLPDFVRNQEKALWRNNFNCGVLDGKTLCVIGTGHIGGALGIRAKALGMRVLGLKRHPEALDGFDDVRSISALHVTLEEADYVALITPLTPETYHLMGRTEFERMKETAVFINVSRGDTVDETALIDALRDKQIAGAVLDVFHEEPLPKDSPLWKMDNVLLSPHNAGLTDDATAKTIDLLVTNVRRHMAGQPLVNQIKKGELY